MTLRFGSQPTVNPTAALVDTYRMSIESIASLSTAMSQVELQNAVSIKVLKLAQGQDQVAADMLDAALQSVEDSMAQFAEDAGAQLDTLA